MPPKFADHIKFPLKVRRTRSHVFIEDADRRAHSTVAYDAHRSCSLDYATFVCKTLARALTDAHDGKSVQKDIKTKSAPDDLSFKVEIWFEEDRGVQQTLAAFAKVTDAKSFLMIARKDYAGRNIKLRQGIRVIWEEGMVARKGDCKTNLDCSH
ncbi:hypothetical protein [Hoeflea poritis]|uniref:Uncharacterized protein n=1 Tax=Hoeflea poritis TaxID=2993659 RepID=A0ABT4VPP0_9HYPH|nr:hypothetical protein [Hoeflea poritis]MDA4845978.1 hypothetical protein [Hoeflea poritis]